MNNKTEIKKKSFQTLLLCVAGILIINIISSKFFFRADLTDDKHFSLTDFTKDYLKDLRGSVMVRVYLDGEELPVSFKRMKDEIKSKLDEFKVYGGQKIDYMFINPTASDKKEVRYGIFKQLYELGLKPVEIDNQTQEQTTKTMIFPCAVICYTLEGKTGEDLRDTTLVREIGLNLLKADPQLAAGDEQNIFNSVETLEYEIINAIYRLSEIEKPKIAFIEGHGEAEEEYLVDICTELSDYYDVRRGNLNTEPEVLRNFSALVIAKPTKPFSEDEKFILDNYIMNGGNVLWLVDATSASMDSLQANGISAVLPLNTNLDDMLFTYGVRLNANVIRDLQCAPIGLTVNGYNNQPQIKLFSWDYFPVILSRVKNPITKHLNYLLCHFAGTIDTVGTNVPIKKTVLLQSGKYSKINNAPFSLSFEQINQKPDPNDFNKPFQTVAVLLEGNFESAFSERKGKTINGKFYPSTTSVKPSKQIVVSDGDIIMNEISPKGEPYPLGFDRNSQNTFKGNKEFIINSLNYLSGNEDLLSIRLKEMKVRILDKQRAQKERMFWSFLNVVLPLFVISLLGLGIYIIRTKKYSKSKEK
ncbi:MAG: gliding motility-associated ABC transporter substrate-binding protein GldG [Bacteroidales bacterium]|nr:gliding motility-associated ABC transporter substrate-binding protein GldG [Bacteroidales bacterium]